MAITPTDRKSNNTGTQVWFQPLQYNVDKTRTISNIFRGSFIFITTYRQLNQNRAVMPEARIEKVVIPLVA